MASLLSPGVQVIEKDFSQIIPSVSSSIGAMVGRFTKGPINTPILISSEDELVRVFGEPTDVNANDWHTVAEFLKYTNGCYVTRASSTSYVNASTLGGLSVQVPNRDTYESMSSAINNAAGTYIAKNPGTSGNNLAVILVDSGSWSAFSAWCTTNIANFPGDISLAAYFNAAPSTTQYVKDRTTDSTPKLDELHALVLDITGGITGVPYTVLEKFEGMSKASDATDYLGQPIYYKSVINEQSQYVWWGVHAVETVGADLIATGSTSLAVSPTNKSFSGILVEAEPFFSLNTLSAGSQGTASTEAEVKAAYDTFVNKDMYSIDLIMCGAFNVGTAGAIEKYVLESVVHARKDCIGFVSPHTSGAPIKDGISATTTIASFKTSVGVSDAVGSYGFMDTGMKYIYDRYSKKYRYVPLNGDMAGLAARTDSTNDAWWSFAGYNRGGIKNVIKFAFNPTQVHREVLYPKGINACIMDPSSGPTLLGDRTMSVKPSAFDRVNVRRLFILLERAISKSVKYQLFEFNDTFTRAQFKNMVEPFLKNIQGKRGITEFLVKCDNTNNPPSLVDRNEFAAEIYIKPARSINFISLTFVATRTDVEFSTLFGA